MTLKFEPESIYDDPNNFHTCAGTHPKSLSICMAMVGDKDELKTLKTCPDFDYECDYEEGVNIYCKHCWALGNYGVCDNNPKGK